jgi:hypothetical protein
MSESEERGSNQVMLKGVDNFVAWRRYIETSMMWKHLQMYLVKDPGAIEKSITAKHPISLADPKQLQRLNDAVEKHEEKCSQAFGKLYGSLSTSIQNRVPHTLLNLQSPNPKLVYDWVTEEYVWCVIWVSTG